ncbi:MAG: shikimate dehydrogenase [archaeon]|jgi:shikimate dehydrogenase
MKINAQTKLFAVIGNPVGHSKSPLIHNLALTEKKINGVYLAFKIENIKNAIVSMKELGVVGYSVTIPHKLEVIKYLDKIDDKAKRIGAVNTIHNLGGKLIGYNTDCFGAINALKQKTTLKGKRVYLLGVGGASRAIITGLVDEGAIVKIFNRSEKELKKFAKEFDSEYGLIDTVDKNFDILINATPVGMYPNTDECPVKKEILENGKNKVVFDIVYNPLETKLLKLAKKSGCKTIAGIEMFLEQAYSQFEIWNNVSPPKEKMKKLLIKTLKNEAKN